MNEIQIYIRKIEKRMSALIIRSFVLVVNSKFSKEGRGKHGYN